MVGLTRSGSWADALWTQEVTPDDLSNNSFFVPDQTGTFLAILHRASGAVVVAPGVGITVY
jgi:hypothetical protein